MKTTEASTQMIIGPRIDTPMPEAKAKRSIKTRIFVHYVELDGSEGLTPGFESMKEVDRWMDSTNVRPIRLIRGVEKKFKMSVTLA